MSSVSNASVRFVIMWLICCSLMVLAMILLGGAVRLTGSGLSMVDWQPLLGIMPPLNESQWQEVFLLYQQYPEYKLLNQDMKLSEFKFIFFMEYAHRILGRIIGLVFFLPLIWISFKGNFSNVFKLRLWGIFLLGGLQGLMGWYMVQSGLVDDPHVSQYRLTAHFLLAVLIYILLVRTAWGMHLFKADFPQIKKGSLLAWFSLIVLFCMLATGGFVAGTKAGFIYNSFPKMGDDWIPAMLFAMQPWWLNFFENPVAIQFLHRWLAIVVLIVVVVFARRIRKSSIVIARQLGVLMIAAAGIQVVLVIITLLYKVPVCLGVRHQCGAIILLTTVVCSWSLFLKPLHFTKFR